MAVEGRDEIPLSIVTTTYSTTRYNDLIKLLESVEAQTIHGIEVILVVDSSEELAEAVSAYSDRRKFRTFELRVLVNEGEQGVDVCRNIGIREARGKIVGVIDDDVVLSPTWSETTISNYLRNKSLVALTGPALPLWENPRLMSWFPRELYFVWGCTVWDWSESRDIRNVGGMNCSFKRDVVIEAGLYDPILGPHGGEERIGWFHPSGEEVDLSLRVRKLNKDSRIMYEPRLVVFHKAEAKRFNMGFVLKRCFRLGYSKRFLELRFISEEHFMNLEAEHLRMIIISSMPSFFREVASSPRIALKKLVTTWLGTIAALMGYFAYSLRPFEPANE